MNEIKSYLETTLYQTETVQITIFGVLAAVLILFFTFILIKVIKRVFKRMEAAGRFESGNSNSIFLLTKYILWLISILISLNATGINISIFLAGGAALLVGVGLGLQQLFNDISSGIVLLIENNLRKHDVIELENGMLGKVIRMGLRTSKVQTRDNIIVVVPNSKFVNDAIINWTQLDVRSRFKVEVGVAYGSDTEKVRDLLLQSTIHPDVKKNPKPFVRFLDFGDSSLNFQVFFWCSDTFKADDVKSDIRFTIDRLFKENDITIPFPQRDLHIKSGSLPATN